MRVSSGFVGLVLFVIAFAVPGGANEEWRPTTGGWVSGNVDYVDTVPFDAVSGSSAKLHRNTLYVTTFRSFSIYDVTDALKPELLSTTPLGVQLFNEQPDTNGKILLLANDTKSVDAGVDPLRLRGVGALDIWDVTDKKNPRQLASLALPKREHIWTCVLDCEYAYGAGGSIVDLSDPANPKIVADWVEQTQAPLTTTTIHTIEEVAPGQVLTGSAMVYYLDAREDPTRPQVLAQVKPTLTVPGAPSNPTSLPAHVDWPNAGTGQFMLMSMETPLAGQCDENSGGFRTYDTTNWESTQRFTLADEYVFTDNPGTYTNGRAAHHVWGCSAYSMGAAEHFETTGQVAVAWFEDGVRLLRVAADGTIDEIGGFLPLGGSSATPIWRNDEVIYTIDMYRGIDILKVTPAE